MRAALPSLFLAKFDFFQCKISDEIRNNSVPSLLKVTGSFHVLYLPLDSIQKLSISFELIPSKIAKYASYVGIVHRPPHSSVCRIIANGGIHQVKCLRKL